MFISYKERQAQQICILMHMQIDRDGKPHWKHCFRVAESLPTRRLRVIGYLHDIMEDTPLSYGEISEAFGSRIARAVLDLTRGDSEPYRAYIQRLSHNPDAVQVKLSDLRDNLSRNPKPHKKLEYEWALSFLS